MLRLVLVFFLAPAALAQDGAHVLPYPTAASEPHVVELALGGADGEALRVHVGASPAWLVFSSPSVASEQSADGGRAGRLAFTVAADAPVGEEGAVALVVTDAVGAERARHTVWLTVAAPELALAAPWPNPSRGAATVAFMLPEGGPVRLSVLDALGREVASPPTATSPTATALRAGTRSGCLGARSRPGRTPPGSSRRAPRASRA